LLQQQHAKCFGQPTGYVFDCCRLAAAEEKIALLYIDSLQAGRQQPLL
jgi:hypothetical protein